MAQNDPWAGVVTTSGAPRVPTTPAIGKVPTLQEKRAKELEKTNQEITLNYNQDRRANQASSIAAAEEERKRKKEARDERVREITGGVDTTEAENNAAHLATLLAGHKREIDRVLEEHPDAAKPGWLEFAADAIGGERGRALAIGKEAEMARQVLNTRYRAAADIILRLGTGAAYNAEEWENFIENYMPQVTDSPELLRTKRAMLEEALLAARVKSGAGVVKVDQALSEWDKAFGGSEGQKPAIDNSALTKIKPGESLPQQRSIADIADPVEYNLSQDKRSWEVPAEFSTAHAQWVRANPNATAEDYINFRQQLDALAVKAAGVGGRIKLIDKQDAETFLDFYRKNPTAEIPSLTSERDLDWHEKVAALLPEAIGEEGSTALINAGNAVSFGTLEGLLATDGQRLSKRMADKRSPIAAMTGDMAGSIIPGVWSERLGAELLAKLGREAPRLGAFAGDVGYNAIRGGMAADEGQGAEGTAKGAGAAVIGSPVGRLMGRGMKGFLDETTQRQIDDLIEKEVDLTTLQRMGAGKFEETFQGTPIIRGAREEANKSWNLAQANETLKLVGESLPKDVEAGFDTNTVVNQILNRKYNEIRPLLQGSFDKIYQNATAALRQQGRASAIKRKLFTNITEIEKTLGAKGYDGNSFKDADQRLRALATDWKAATAETVDTPSIYHDMGDIAEKYRRQLRLQVERNHPEVAQKLKALDRAWSRNVRTERASLSARAQKAEGVYSPGELLDSSKMLDTSPKRGLSARGKAFGQQEALEASRVMGSKPVPETSSFLQGGAATGVSYKLPKTVTALGSALYAPGVKRVSQALLTADRAKLAAKYGIPEKVVEAIAKKIPPEALAAALARYKATEK